MSTNVSIVNVVGGGELCVQINLDQLFINLNVEEIEYEPETSSMLRFKIEKDGPTIMLFSSGSYFLAGASSVNEARETYHNMLYELEQVGMNSITPYFEIRNVVCKLDLEKEFELSELLIALGMEHCEYNPEQSPGLFCRLPGCEGLFHIFRTGVVLSTGAGSIDEVSKDVKLLFDKFNEINIDLDNEVTNTIVTKLDGWS